MSDITKHKIKEVVRDRYAGIAAGREESCCGGGSPCGGETQVGSTSSLDLGYSSVDLEGLPEGADLGLGCGNPHAIADFKAGEVAVDLGSGAGIDCFLAARRVGAEGRVIGVDMTHEMLEKARGNARRGGFANVEFRLGEIEHLPIADNTADVILSNCVINLSPDKPQAYREMFRVLKPGGRIAISDVVATAEMPEDIKQDMAAYTGCMAGASYIGDLEKILKEAGFIDVRISAKNESKAFIKEWAPGRKIEDYVLSANIEARKPAAK